jgi:membrane dipeptidase
MPIYIPTELQDAPSEAVERANTLIDLVEQMAEIHPEQFAVATSPNEVRQIADTDALALPMGLENGAGLGGKIESVEHFYDRGIGTSPSRTAPTTGLATPPTTIRRRTGTD